MNYPDHPQDDLDIQNLLQQAPTDMNAGTVPANQTVKHNYGQPVSQTPPAANTPPSYSRRDSNNQETQTLPQEPGRTAQSSLGSAYPSAQAARNAVTQNEMTQAIPQNHNPVPPAADHQEDDEFLDPEDLDNEDYDFEDDDDLEKRRKTLIICICAGVLTVLIALIGIIIFIVASSGDDNQDDPASKAESSQTGITAGEKIHDNVTVGAFDIGGKTVEQAKSFLHLKTDHIFTNGNMVINLCNDSIVLTPDQTAAKLDVDAVVNAAFSCGREGYISEDGTYTIDLLPHLSLNYEYIEETINAFCEKHSVLKQPQVTLNGSRPQFDPANPNKEIDHQSLSITIGSPAYELDAEDIYEKVLYAYSMNQMVIDYKVSEPEMPETLSAADLFEEYCTAPVDAVMDPSTYEITPETFGYGFDVDTLQKLIDEADYGETLPIIEFKFLAPAVLSSELSQNMFVDTLADYQNSSSMNDSKRDNNLSLSCDAINNHIVHAGDTFSFNKVLGKISIKNGYATAPVSVLNGNVMGGGISQTASALYACALGSNLEIVERHNHEFAVDFCELGLDAFVDGDKHDLRFRNNTGAPIRILAEATGGRVRIQIIGENKLDYKIEIATKVVSEIKPLTTYQNMEEGNATGFVDGDIIQAGITGYKISVQIERYKLDSGELLSVEDVSTSVYAKLDEVVARIVPTVTEPPVTEPTIPPTEATTPSEPTEPTNVTESTDATDPIAPTSAQVEN